MNWLESDREAAAAAAREKEREADEIADALDRSIMDAVSLIRRDIRAAQTTYDTATRELKAKLVAVQAGCPHRNTTCHPGPTIGSDCYDECVACGKVW